jgi:hypothetical protein
MALEKTYARVRAPGADRLEVAEELGAICGAGERQMMIFFSFRVFEVISFCLLKNLLPQKLITS